MFVSICVWFVPSIVDKYPKIGQVPFLSKFHFCPRSSLDSLHNLYGIIMVKLSTAALALGTFSGAAAASSWSARGLESEISSSTSKAGKGKGKACKADQGDSTSRFSTVYTMTNQPNNEIVIFKRNEVTGKLTFIDTVETGGEGHVFKVPNDDGELVDAVDDPLASTGSVIVAGDGRQSCLLAVNAGSNTVSSFKIGSAPDQLTRVSVEATGGLNPTSITEKDGLVYVLNAGDVGSIVGFNLIGFTCKLTPLEQGPIALSRPNYVGTAPYVIAETPAQIGFTPKNEILVTIKQNNGGPPDFDNGTGSLNLYEVDPEDGTITIGSLTQTNLNSLTRTQDGHLPFSFTFDSSGNVLLVEPALAGSFQNGVVSVIENVDSDSSGDPVTISSEATTEASASCWIQYNPTSSCVYTTNNVEDTISSFLLDNQGELNFVSNRASALNAPIDMIQSLEYRFLYALSTGHTDGSGQPSIYVYEMTCDCGLKFVQRIEDGLESETERQVTAGVLNGYVGIALYTSH